MISVYLQSVGVAAPGLADWSGCREVLAGRRAYLAEPLPRYNPAMLPANERRRITPVIRLAMQAAADAVAAGDLPADGIATVFASSHGDLDIADRICQVLTLPEKPVSPTDFHNSVHNAAAGYWSIGARCRLPSTSLSAGPASFAAALLESVTQVASGAHPVMLVCYDRPPPAGITGEPSDAEPFAAALLLTRAPGDHALGQLELQLAQHGTCRPLGDAALEHMRRTNPAAQALLLLETVAQQAAGSCVLPYLDTRGIAVGYRPC